MVRDGSLVTCRGGAASRSCGSAEVTLGAATVPEPVPERFGYGRPLVAWMVALVLGSGLQQRAVDREVFGRMQPLPARFAHDLLEQQTFAVLRECRRVERFVLDVQVQEPLE